MTTVYTLENTTGTGTTIVEHNTSGNAQQIMKMTFPTAEAIEKLQGHKDDWTTKNDSLAERIAALTSLQDSIGTILTDLQSHIDSLTG